MPYNRKNIFFNQEVLNLKAKVLQLDEEKEGLQRDKEELILRIITVSISQEKYVSTEDLVRPMSLINLKNEEIKDLEEENKKLKQEVVQRLEKVDEIQKEKKTL